MGEKVSTGFCWAATLWFNELNSSKKNHAYSFNITPPMYKIRVPRVLPCQGQV
jgi:hypothetical protein